MKGLFIFGILLCSIFSNAQNLTSGKIPIDVARWYQVNNTGAGAMAPLFNGVLQEKIDFGFGLMLSNWDAYYPVLSGEVIQIESIKMFDWEGVFADKPTTIYAIDDKWQKTQIASFTGPRYNLWTGPYPDQPDQYNLTIPATNIKYIVINTYGNMPSEIEFYGKYQAPPTAITSPFSVVPPKHYPLKSMSGVNGFEWNFLTSDGFGIIPKSLQMGKAFGGFRHYLDWQKLENSEGSYTFSPCNSGSWDLDKLYSTLKNEQIEVLACIKTIPDWMVNTYPSDRKSSENAAVKFGRDLSLPQSYIEQAKVVFQFAARYGSNTSVNPALISLNSKPRWTGDMINTVRIGLDLVKYIECNNETDRWWKGRDSYQTGREYAANMSAFYDGHLNTMGPGVGAKNADPNIKIVMAGTAMASTDYVRGMIDWCAQNRGYLPDGSVNCCWDIINYHIYSNDAKFSASGNNATKGVSPEMVDYESTATDFVKMSAVYGKNMPVWITETGYDILPNGSSQYAPVVGNKTVLETQADWILRTSLLSARAGIAKTFFYEMYDDNPFGGQYGSSGLINDKDSTRRPSAQYLNQVNQNFGNYVFQENINHNPEVDRYEYNKQSMFVLWSPTQNATTINYSLELGKMDSASIYQLNSLVDTMSVSLIKNTQSSLQVPVSETPIFVVPHLHQIDLIDFGIRTVDAHKVGMSWTVSSDSTVQKFSVERMNETTKVFSSIGTVLPNAVHTLLPKYTFIDTAANNGFNHYRIKITVGTLSYFYTNVDQAFVGSMIAYPNPFTESITLQGLSEGRTSTLKIFSLDGSMVKLASTSANIFQWHLGSLPNGVYSLIADDGISQQRIRINKMPQH